MLSNQLNEINKTTLTTNYYNWQDPESVSQYTPSDPTLSSILPPLDPECVKIDPFAMTIWDLSPADAANPEILRALGVEAAQEKLLTLLNAKGLTEEQRLEMQDTVIAAYTEIIDTLVSYENEYGWLPGLCENLAIIRSAISKELQNTISAWPGQVSDALKEFLIELQDTADNYNGKLCLEPIIVSESKSQLICAFGSSPVYDSSEQAAKTPVPAEETPPPPPPQPTAKTGSLYGDTDYSAFLNLPKIIPQKSAGGLLALEQLPEELFRFRLLFNSLYSMIFKVSEMTNRWFLDALYRQAIEKGR